MRRMVVVVSILIIAAGSGATTALITGTAMVGLWIALAVMLVAAIAPVRFFGARDRKFSPNIHKYRKAAPEDQISDRAERVAGLFAVPAENTSDSESRHKDDASREDDTLRVLRMRLTAALDDDQRFLRKMAPSSSRAERAAARRRRAPSISVSRQKHVKTGPSPAIAADDSEQRVPVRGRHTPLPHSGLYVRRNNAFGTRSVISIADMIDQGLLVDQEQVRFDDFVASRSDGVPVPPAGEAVAVSYGCAATPDGSSAHDATTHFLEIALRAADNLSDGGQGSGGSLPGNFVFVVDTSASMSGEKLDIVKGAIRQLFSTMRDGDVLGVVTFDTHVRTALKATRKADLEPGQVTKHL